MHCCFFPHTFLQKLYLQEIQYKDSKAILSRPVAGPLHIAWGITVLSVSTFFGMKFPKYSHQYMIIWFVWVSLEYEQIQFDLKKCTFDILAGIVLLWQLCYSQVFCCLSKKVSWRKQYFILLTNYFSCMHNYLTPMPLVVFSLMKGVLYLTMSAAKGCLMSVHQINNWSRPGLCLHCFDLKKCSLLILQGLNQSPFGVIVYQMYKYEMKLGWPFYIIPLILVVFKGLFYIICVQNSSYEECHFRPYDPDEAIKLR